MLKSRESPIKDMKRKHKTKKQNEDLDISRRKTILCESNDKLKNDLKRSITRQRTQDPSTEQNILLATNDNKKPFSRNGGYSNLGDPLEELKKDVNQRSNKIMNYALVSPIIQRHERTPSFINKLPTEIKQNMITATLSNASDNSKSNFLSVGDNYVENNVPPPKVIKEDEKA